MSVTDLILIVLVAAGAFYAGFQVGRLKALAEGGGAGRRDGGDQPPLSGPLDGPLDEASAAPSRRAAPPPASASQDDDWQRRAPPRRSSKPPPASAGLMDTGATEKPGTRQK
jgi:hypothetical protein